MKAEQQIIKRLRDARPDMAHKEADIWDVLPAARGLTIIMLDGSVHPLKCSDGAAKTLLHAWAVQAVQ